MKKTVLLASMLFFAVCSNSFASSNSEYVVDDVAIEATLSNGVQVTKLELPSSGISESTPFDLNAIGGQPKSAIVAERTPVIAFILSWFLGPLGIHRFYMGTATLTGVGYILTLGGCGIVALVDWVVLLIALVQNDGISKYEDNPKFFMWSGK
jgi:TM2 domain-containing membrane protein YozV